MPPHRAHPRSALRQAGGAPGIGDRLAPRRPGRRRTLDRPSQVMGPEEGLEWASERGISAYFLQVDDSQASGISAVATPEFQQRFPSAGASTPSRPACARRTAGRRGWHVVVGARAVGAAGGAQRRRQTYGVDPIRVAYSARSLKACRLAQSQRLRPRSSK